MKKNIPLGILFGLLLSVAMLAISASSTAKSASFYLSQNDKYKIVQNAGFESVDHYIRSYNFVTDSFSGKEVESATVKDTEIFTKNQLAGFKKQGQILTASILSSLVLALAIATCVIVWAQKQKREEKEYYQGLFFFGISSFITAFVIAAALNIAKFYIPPECFAPMQSGFSAVLFSPEFFADFLTGVTRFFNFLTLIPLFISYLFIKRRTKAHPNDDYLYQ